MSLTEDTLRYVELAKIEELEADYTSKGYRTVREYRVGQRLVDLMVERGDRQIFIEVKALKHLDSKVLQALRQQTLQSNPDAEFRVVIANPPAQKSIEIESLPTKIRQWLNDHMRDSIRQWIGDQISHGTGYIEVDDVVDLEILKLYIPKAKDEQIQATIRGTLLLTFHYNDRRADSEALPVELPFQSELGLDLELDVKHMTPRFDPESLVFL
ncbi:MAG: hypothetical protein M1415_11400 [Firmicutes bacterium]|jgi:hypothetical protein|nr:hypothetical protein [Bacillota bacterium]MCL5065600.1 hypothetical protein [Bacillota bacterium]